MQSSQRKASFNSMISHFNASLWKSVTMEVCNNLGEDECEQSLATYNLTKRSKCKNNLREASKIQCAKNVS